MAVTVEQAIALVRACALTPKSARVALKKAAGRVLLEPVTAVRDQPPFRASAMDGYAARRQDLHKRRPLQVIGESVAGRRFTGAVAEGAAVRIFTGAPVPDDCDTVVIQENTRAADGGIEVLPDGVKAKSDNVRAKGQDFRTGDGLMDAGLRLDAWRLSLAAAAGCAEVTVAKKPRVAVLCTGDELVLPGHDPGADQIYESASWAIMAMVRQWGGKADYLGVEGDSVKDILKGLKKAEADLIVTVGGASVGDYDFVKPALTDLGLTLAFDKVAIRPGKPTSFGTLADGRRVLGLPGNPASAFVVAQLLLKPWIEASLGVTVSSGFVTAVTQGPLPAAGPRETYLRARLSSSLQGQLQVTAFDDQDSSLISVFAAAAALIRLPANTKPQNAGSRVEVLPLDRL